jgi:hypothetical protein
MKHVNARRNVHVRRRGKKRSVKPDFILVSDYLCVTGNAIGPAWRRRVASRRVAARSTGQR